MKTRTIVVGLVRNLSDELLLCRMSPDRGPGLRPIIFPLSNPSDLAEAQPEDIVRWTAGTALIGTGSPFDPVEWEGRSIHIGQGNNAFMFPGVGLGSLVAGAREVTDGMFTAGAQALAGALTEEEMSRSQLYPAVSRLREVTQEVAVAVVEQALVDGVAEMAKLDDVAQAVADAMWSPDYPELVPV